MEYKILVADDDKDILNTMVKRIKASGYTVISAKDGEEAWQKIIKENPDIIILDLNMPKMDGYAVLKNLREQPPTQKWQPVIIVSARDEIEDMQKGFSLEADHYLTKPCRIQDILKAITMMINLIPQRKSKFEMDAQKKPSSS